MTKQRVIVNKPTVKIELHAKKITNWFLRRQKKVQKGKEHMKQKTDKMVVGLNRQGLQMKKSMKPKADFFEKTNESNKPWTRFIKKKTRPNKLPIWGKKEGALLCIYGL